MNTIKNLNLHFLLVVAAQLLAMCSTAMPPSEEYQLNERDNSFVIINEMSAFKVSDNTDTFRLDDTGRYVLSYSWTDADENTNLPSPEGLKFTVSAWSQDKEIYDEHFYVDPIHGVSTENFFLEISKQQTSKPIEILVIGTISSSSSTFIPREGTLNVFIHRDKSGG